MIRTRRKFTKKFKLEVVRAYLESGENQAAIATRYNIGKSAISGWIARYSSEARGAKHKSVERQQVKAERARENLIAAMNGNGNGTGHRTLRALANVVHAVETLGPQERRTVIEAVLRLLPPS